MPKGDDSWDESGSDPDAPQPADIADDDDEEALPDMACPACGARVTEDTQKCPHCGDWITPVAPGGGWKKWWLAVAVMLMLLAMLRMVL
jgi:DNA-directed RNA polymerase subunit RPC12/RpoP